MINIIKNLFKKKQEPWVCIYFTPEGSSEKRFEVMPMQDIVFLMNRNTQKNDVYYLVHKNMEKRIYIYILQD